MKTPKNIVRFTLLGLGLSLAGCGEDPLLLAELIVSNDNGEGASPQEPPSEPEQPDVDEPEPPSPPVDAYPEDSDEGRFLDLMDQYCGGCHAGPGSIGFDDVSDVERLIDQGQIDPGRKESSRLYERIIDGSMPPAFIQNNRLSPEEIEFIGDFIDSL